MSYCYLLSHNSAEPRRFPDPMKVLNKCWWGREKHTDTASLLPASLHVSDLMHPFQKRQLQFTLIWGRRSRNCYVPHSTPSWQCASLLVTSPAMQAASQNPSVLQRKDAHRWLLSRQDNRAGKEGSFSMMKADQSTHALHLDFYSV